MATGRVFLASNHWVVETPEGESFQVRSGEPGLCHPVLNRGRHENCRVEYRLDDKTGKAIVILV